MAVLSKGTKLLIGDDDDPIAWTAIPGVTGIQVPAPTKDEHDVSDLDSTDKEYIAGLGDSGEITFTMNLKSKASGSGFAEAQELLEAANVSGDLTNFKVTLPAPFSKSYIFTAFVKTFQPNAQVNAAVTADVTLRISGSVTREVAP